MPNKLVTIAIFLFIAYVIFNNSDYKINPIKRINLPKEIFEPINKDGSLLIKVFKLIGKPEDLREVCGVSKLQLSSQPNLVESFKIFKINNDNKANFNPIKCGDDIKFSYKIYKLNGDLLFENKNQIKLGDIEVPYAIHKAMIYSDHLSNLTIITPSEYLIKNILLKNLKDFYDKNLLLPDAQMMMLDLSILN